MHVLPKIRSYVARTLGRRLCSTDTSSESTYRCQTLPGHLHHPDTCPTLKTEVSYFFATFLVGHSGDTLKYAPDTLGTLTDTLRVLNKIVMTLAEA